MKWFTRIWVGIAIILPALIGLALTFAPDQLASPTTTVNSLAGMVGARDLIFSGLLVTAFFMLGERTLGVLMIGRGLIDLTDGLRSVAAGGVSGGAMIPIIFAVLSFVVAFLLLQTQGRPTAQASRI